MRRICILVLAFAALTNHGRAEDPKAEASELKALATDFEQKEKEYTALLHAAKTPDERTKAKEKDPAPTFGPKFRELAAKAKGTDTGLEATVFAMRLSNGKSPEDVKYVQMSTDELQTTYLQSEALERAVVWFPGIALHFPREGLVKAAQKIEESSPHKNVQAAALYARAELCETSAPDESKALFEKVIEKFKDTKYAKEAQGKLHPAEGAKGKGTPAEGKGGPTDFEADDTDGKKLKLSEYRGKVVVLVFWFEDPNCKAMVQEVKPLLDRYKDKPFALVGVNSDADRKKALDAVKEHGMTWRQALDPSKSISKEWAATTCPSIFVLDEKGVVKARHVRGAKIAAAVDEALKEPAEAKGPPEKK
jgi:peroxiredoxin